MEARGIGDIFQLADMANVHACAVVDISAKAIVIQSEFLVKQILQVFIYSETVNGHVFFFQLKKMFVQKI